ncbi:MAG: hypothetical protein HC915_10020 [Anaerolineae bacterium]|nr:hypothetical protein [Anaerolineae bacterium]
MRRLMPNGTYTWELTAVTDAGETDTRTGTLVITEADAELPDLPVFTISPQTFSPNQDGIRDRTQINVVLAKAANLDVYLLTEDGAQIFVPPQIGETRDGEAGRYTYDYDGGIDAGADPPPAGTYTVVAAAQDAVGQRVERRATLTLEDGGKPLAEIAAQPTGADVVFTVEPYDDALFSAMDALGESIPLPDDPAGEVMAEFDRLRHSKGKTKPYELRQAMQETMMNNVGVFRIEAGMAKAVADLKEIRHRYITDLAIDDHGMQYNSDLMEAWELGCMLDLADTTALSALCRTESRGAHSREDYPQRDDENYLKHTFAIPRDGQIEIDFSRNVDLSLSIQPKERVY